MAENADVQFAIRADSSQLETDLNQAENLVRQSAQRSEQALDDIAEAAESSGKRTAEAVENTAQSAQDTAEALNDVAEAAADSAEEVGNSARQAEQSFSDISEAAEQTGESASEAAGAVGESAQVTAEALDDIAEAAQRAGESAADAGEELKVNYNGVGSNAWLRNDGTGTIYASVSPRITAGADGVVSIPAGRFTCSGQAQCSL